MYFSDKLAKAVKLQLGLEMRRRLLPPLAQLDFKIRRRIGAGKDKDGFPLDHYRVCEERIDVIHFQWSKYGTPFFIINFGMIDRTGLAADSDHISKEWFWAQGYRVSRARCFTERWFGVGQTKALLLRGIAISSAVNAAALRLKDMDAFMQGKPPTAYVRGEDGVRKPERKLMLPD